MNWEDGLALVGYKVRHLHGAEGRLLGPAPHRPGGRSWLVKWGGESGVSYEPENELTLLPLNPETQPACETCKGAGIVDNNGDPWDYEESPCPKCKPETRKYDFYAGYFWLQNPCTDGISPEQFASGLEDGDRVTVTSGGKR